MRYVAIRSEGGLLPYDLLDKIIADQVAGQKPADFGLAKGQRLIDEISRVWADAQNLWSNFKRRRQSLTERDPYGTSITRSWIVSLLSDPEMLGFDLKLQTSAVVVNNLTFAISHRNGDGEDAIPVHIEGCKIDLDRRLHTKLRTSPRAMLQDFLNNSEQSSWGILANGVTLRLIRDSSRTSRPTYLEFDLESILEGNRFNEFALFYRLCHRSRFPRPGQEPTDCLLEKYYLDSIEQGLRVRDNLRDGVEEALKILGSAFLQHPANGKLRTDYAAGKLTPEVFHRQLLLLVYRLLFLMVAEERGLIVSLGEHADRSQKIYDEWYSVTRLRERAARIVEASPFGDLWIGLKETFSLFEYGLDTNALGIPPLNGDLFNENRAIPDLAIAEVYNHELLVAVRHLSLFRTGNAYQRVNYSALDVEELGSVYESLLDFKPVIAPGERGTTFSLRTGTERKSTGSYYTRPELVHELIESALAPVIEDRIASAEKAATGRNLVEERDEKIKAILSLTVCDPACGSGHFLLAAARRIGKELARVRTGEDEPRPEDFHLAVRDAISHCIYGVDLNPLAVDLCKLALWLEGHWAGKPLSFLDHRIRCGNSLIGVLDPAVLEQGIPDDAFAAATGDDKKVGAFFKKRNKQERTSRQRGLTFEADDHTGEYAASNRELRELVEDTAADVRKKAQMYTSWRAGMQHSHDEAVADLWTAQFFLPLASTSDPAICTNNDFLEFAVDKRKKPQQVAAAEQIAQQVRFFHWHLEFPEVLESGGFDVVLGNPPWDALQPEEIKFLTALGYTTLAALPGDRRKKEMQRELERDEGLNKEWQAYLRQYTSASSFIRSSTRFPLCAVGKLNTYPLFAETGRTILAGSGRLGLVLPTGIITDDNTKAFFSSLMQSRTLVSVVGFENEAFIFSDVHNEFKFCAITIQGGSAPPVPATAFIFYCRHFEDLLQGERRFSLTTKDLQLLNPNTLTCPVFRTGADAEINKGIYQRVPVFANDGLGTTVGQVGFKQGLFNMTSDSSLFRTRKQLEAAGWDLKANVFVKDNKTYDPLYEAKMIQQYDHRFATLIGVDSSGKRPSRKYEGWFGVDPNDSTELAIPRYWVPREDVERELATWKDDWLVGFRDVTNAVVERTAIFSVLPRVGIGHKIPLLLVGSGAVDAACLVANGNSLILDYAARQKIGGTSFALFILKQLPFVPFDAYTAADKQYIAERVLELTYTAIDLRPFAKDLGFAGAPFAFSEPRRALLRCELDAYFAHLYGLTRDDLRYILDPQDIFGESYPGQTFRLLKVREVEKYGEHRTQRLVLEAYDELAGSDRFRHEIAKRVSSIQGPTKAASSGRD